MNTLALIWDITTYTVFVLALTLGGVAAHYPEALEIVRAEPSDVEQELTRPAISDESLAKLDRTLWP